MSKPLDEALYDYAMAANGLNLACLYPIIAGGEDDDDALAKVDHYKAQLKIASQELAEALK